MTYRYAEVEQALASLHGVGPDYMGAFRGRIIHLQRVGIAPPSPGRGKKLQYELKDVLMWALAFELLQFSVDPKRLALMSQMLWVITGPSLMSEQEDEDIFFAAYPLFMTREWIESDMQSGVTGQGIFPLMRDGNYVGSIFKFSELKAEMLSRALLINLSLLRRRVIDALADVA